MSDIVKREKRQKTRAQEVSPSEFDAATPFMRSAIAGSATASWLAGVCTGIVWIFAKPVVLLIVRIGGFVFGLCLWVAAACGVLALIGWLARKGE